MLRKYRYLLLSVFTVIVIGAVFYIHNYFDPGPPNLPNPSLKVLAARHGIELGNFAMYDYLNVKPYAQILTSQFDLAIIDNTPNWYFTGNTGLRPSPTTYNFSQMDQIVSFAENHQMAIQAHHLVWGEEKWLPGWLKNGNYSQAQLLSIMQNDIYTVVGHYKGKIKEWSVVNEAFTREQHINGLNDWWADHLGGDSYISKAFIWAHQDDPSAQLILNDFDNETENSVSNAMYNYIKSAKSQGVPINGIGMQMHISGADPPTKAQVVANMRRFGSLGVDVYVTEFDVNMSGVPGTNNSKEQKEADIYYQMMSACIEAGDCHSFSILGITDKETWYNYLGTTPDAMPLPFNDKFQPKPAFYSFRQALIN